MLFAVWARARLPSGDTLAKLCQEIMDWVSTTFARHSVVAVAWLMMFPFGTWGLVKPSILWVNLLYRLCPE